LGGSRISPCISRPALGQGSFGARLAARCLANFNACAARQAGCRPRPAASRRVLTPSIYNKKRTVFNKRVRPLPAANTLKTLSAAAGHASCLQRLRTACWGGRGAGTPAPEKQTLRQNFQGVERLKIILYYKSYSRIPQVEIR